MCWRWVGLLLLLSTPALAQTIPEPQSYRVEEYRAPTPATLQGAKVLDTAEAAALWKAGSAKFVDVMPRAPKPANLPKGTIWRPAERRGIPGSIWLVDTGYGDLAQSVESYFQHGLQTATSSNLAQPVVFYCQRNCWMSWNAARRAVHLGYTQVKWYPEGTDGWAEAGFPLEVHEPSTL
ncbi:PQQ-dependent catabolism-associated CXXCW motif protein [Aureimonas fodinaquatilis]|uniref:PQQ-dependent catabolism-associated CXXCW motif protein n=1 Tax=Aureimonas fodinaquatilis TaxID=2565783 RepID=A0A5B0DS73_9HYPH|nr:PQQ-dependent catabolism-associated CXXCW motif protein [Aureimonas fodinaquatilis]KAA0968601.1 PQQ-dependent catabolism-associated CXXCW motif protein [Aureimonas fodinaquatilis]